MLLKNKIKQLRESGGSKLKLQFLVKRSGLAALRNGGRWVSCVDSKGRMYCSSDRWNRQCKGPEATVFLLEISRKSGVNKWWGWRWSQKGSEEGTEHRSHGVLSGEEGTIHIWKEINEKCWIYFMISKGRLRCKAEYLWAEKSVVLHSVLGSTGFRD